MAGPVLDRGIGGLRDKAKRYSVFSLARQAASYHTGWQQAWRHAEPKSEYDAVIIGGGGHGL
ncbi:MAG: sarcosine oxidase subunit beta, partial [Candidatus Puniceispirillaceae bacterium]